MHYLSLMDTRINFTEDTEAVRVEQFYDRSTRSWVTYLVDAHGYQTGDALYDGTKADAAASKARLESEL